MKEEPDSNNSIIFTLKIEKIYIYIKINTKLSLFVAFILMHAYGYALALFFTQCVI